MLLSLGGRLMVDLRLSNGSVCQVDAADVAVLSAQRWHLSKRKDGRVYVVGHVHSGYKLTYLHRFLLNAPAGVFVDHINGDALDNRRSNLRLCTATQNAINSRRKSPSGFRGVFKRGASWTASIMVDGAARYLGCYPTAEEGARVYDGAAARLHGEFAVLNFPEDLEASLKLEPRRIVRVWTDREKRSAVADIEALGVTGAARKCGATATMVRRWERALRRPAHG